LAANESFGRGKAYRYADLMAALPGGSHQFYLPFRGQEVFAALLNKEKNPDAPNAILVGSKKRVVYAAALLLDQRTPIPVFMKDQRDSWICQGLYRSDGVLSQSKTELLARNARRSDVTLAIKLKLVETAAGGGDLLQEGACNQVTRDAFERDLAARATCIAYYGPRCVICEVEFGDEYGEASHGFMHIHHLEARATNDAGPANPTKDLVPVCPNCHAMLHNGDTLQTPKELRARYWSDASTEARRHRHSRAGWKGQ
jgi:predicted HNH restriction endonuclease